MPKALKRNAVIVFGLAVLFYWSFMLAKHDPSLRDIIPFGTDPYDAVGSFGVIAGVLIALLSLLRAFRPYRKHLPSTAQRVYLVRSQVAVVLAVLITLVADLVAMARHPHMWIGAASRDRLVALLGAIAVVTCAVQLLIRASQQKLPEGRMKHWQAAAIATLLAILALAFYPEKLINGTATHLLTVIVGDIVLFAPMRFLLIALVPFEADRARVETTLPRSRFSTAGQRWGIVLVVGCLIGAFVFWGEMSEGSGALPMGRLVFVASVFIGLGLAGLLLAFAFLGEPLGLGQQA
jgi:hypothetical protein